MVPRDAGRRPFSKGKNTLATVTAIGLGRTRDASGSQKRRAIHAASQSPAAVERRSGITDIAWHLCCATQQHLWNKVTMFELTAGLLVRFRKFALQVQWILRRVSEPESGTTSISQRGRCIRRNRTLGSRRGLATPHSAEVPALPPVMLLGLPAGLGIFQ